MIQGLSEPNAAFVIRLQRSFDTWRVGGSDWAIFQEVLPQLLPSTPPVTMVSDSSGWSYYDAGANVAVPPLHYTSTVANWNWDGETFDPGNPAWWRTWLILFSYAPNAWAAAGPTLGTGGVPVLGSPDNVVIGSLGFSNVSAQFWITLRQILTPWKAAHAWIRYVIVCFDGSHFARDVPQNVGINPDGTFGPSVLLVGGIYVANFRFTQARYCAGVP
jgi:hypothetical protein